MNLYPTNLISHDTDLSHPGPGPTTSGARLRLNTILFVLGPDHALTNFLMDHPSWDCSRANSLNFEVPTESEASELPKDLVLRRYENIHMRLI
ncbi:hypothetical protein DVH24_040439 [Malus domestica]|uniref:Uncharacterized protein n=1 Tax=Malus domestica TaxID=3750 RepID=A0A498IAN7_MALDO|nr:hypothetical protein DVH24_040439 [Malus domestica]